MRYSEYIVYLDLRKVVTQMIDAIKEVVISKGMAALQSPVVAKLMESEKMGVVLEKAMSLPVMVSDGMRGHRDKLMDLLELAKQEDLDDVKRSVSRMEDLLSELKKESQELLKKSKTPAKPKK